ncbi:MAG: BCCT family transporter [Aminobacterium sp.]|jgi:glycine betaine transporter|uniref:BCCT family transporter n=1 Tax=unclassified Aminobacterium TaxID=2685012 RepID=UPI001BCBE4BD|nr:MULTISPECIES: BCCT family transporter [unclassified Aminobacterium]MDD2206775.1 BCCT family transporter [Aminobacterium sp.]MDD3427017.1 BCCT family transporter [Aminobacterium sp.]MDD4229115.1 BCCT family transporter [Aminobacterium sp.]MDD4552316.1 BCCT family transporter [Aminobacterium sp.]MEA4878413.1 BCCT family transporter [Aminobacterium sp.]
MGKSKKMNPVFIVALCITLFVVVWGIVDPEGLGVGASNVFDFLIAKFGWLYVSVMSLLLLFCVIIAFSRFGKIKLGDPDSKPEFSNFSWLAMLFSGSMGIGLVFYSVGEPLMHYMAPPLAEPRTAEAAAQAMQITFHHWGLHPWAGFCVMGLAIAYAQYRRGGKALVSSFMIPLTGEAGQKSVVCKIIDILAIFATLAGLATSLGLGAMQITSGLNHLLGLPDAFSTQMSVIIVITCIYVAAAVSGINKGIKMISDLNLYIAFAIMLVMFAVGPTVSILGSFLNGIGYYFSGIVKQSFLMAPYGGALSKWLGGWTVFYWAWWMAWAPFAGSFIARVSKGRTVREFIIGALLTPSLGTFVWFAVFGTSGIHLDIAGIAPVGQAVLENISTGLYKVFSYYPLGQVLSGLAAILVSTFFITSGQAASLVLAMYSEDGEINPSKIKIAIWGILLAALAAVLLMSGGLKALQTISIVAAFPFSVVMLIACVAIWKGFSQDPVVKNEIAERMRKDMNM